MPDPTIPDSGVDDKGRCCGRKPHVYKGGAWNSPPEAPFMVCFRCGDQFEIDGRPYGARRREEWEKALTISDWQPGMDGGLPPEDA